MDYQYINTVLNEIYIDLPEKYPFPASCTNDVVKYGSADHFMRANVPEMFSYFKVKGENNGLPILVLSHGEQKQNSASICRFVQCFGWDLDGELLRSRFDELIDAPFYTEDEIDAFAVGGQAVPLPRSTDKDVPQQSVNAAPDAIRAIVNGTMKKWLRGGDAVQIAVPEGVDYNTYVKSAIKTIYSYFPTAFCAEAGFCSYMPREVQAKNRYAYAYITFVPQTMADGDTIFLDGSSVGAINKLLGISLPRQTEAFIGYVCALNDEERKQFFSSVFKDVEGAGDKKAFKEVTAWQYNVYGDAIGLLTSTGSVDECLPQWTAFFANIGNYPEGIREQVKAHIAANLTPEMLKKYAVDEMAGLPIKDAVAAVGKYNALCAESEEYSEAIKKALEEKLNSSKCTEKEGYELLCDNKDSLSNIVSAERRNEIGVRAYTAELEEIKKRPHDMVEQIDAAEKEVLEFRGRAEKALDENDNTRKFIATINAYIDELHKIKDSSEVQFKKTRTQLKNCKGYFDMLELFAEKKADISQYTPAQSAELKKIVDSKRPQKWNEYKRAFNEHYERKLILSNFARLPADVCQRIVADVSSMDEITVEMKNGKKAQEQTALILNQLGVARFISEKCRVKVGFNGKELDARRMLDLLDCKKTSGDAEEDRRILLGLIDKGCFVEQDIEKLIENIPGDKEKACKTLFVAVMEGKFDCTYQGYKTAFGKIYDIIKNEKGDEKALVKIKRYEETVKEPNEEARKVYDEWIKGTEKELKKAQRANNKGIWQEKKISLPIFATVAALAVLLAGTSTVMGVKYSKTQREKEAYAVSLNEKENAIAGLNDYITVLANEVDERFSISFFNEEFDAYYDKFWSAYNNENNEYNIATLFDETTPRDTLLACGDEIISPQEYGFWLVVYAADDNGRLDQASLDAARVKAECAIAILHSQLQGLSLLPGQEEVPESDDAIGYGQETLMISPADEMFGGEVTSEKWETSAAEAVSEETMPTGEEALPVGDAVPAEEVIPEGETLPENGEATGETAEVQVEEKTQADLIEEHIAGIRNMFEERKTCFLNINF